MGGNPVGGYLRPSVSGDEHLLELALRQGRWDIALVDGCAAPLAAWQNVWVLNPPDGVPALAGADYFAELDDTLLCPIAAASWRSDVTCAQQDAGTCEVTSDDSYWQAVADQEAAAAVDAPAPTDAPTVEPTARVITRVVQAPAAPPPPAQVVYQQGPTPEPQVVTVYSTVLVYAPSVPTATSTVVPLTSTPIPIATVDLAAYVTPGAFVPSVPAPDPVVPVADGRAAIGIGGLVLAGVLAIIAMMVSRRNREREDA